jgi:predicted flavoprotein YhiN
VNEAASVWDKHIVTALKEIAGIETIVEKAGRLFSDKDRVEESVQIARAAIGQSESEAFAGGIGNVTEMAPPPQHSRHDQQIAW